jgi:CheY-like chemotaxis protein
MKDLKKILLAEDNSQIRSLVETILGRVGFKADSFANGADALAHYLALENRNQHYSAVISDIEMPAMNGLELYHRIRAEEQTHKPFHVTPFLIMSGDYHKFTKEIKAILDSDRKAAFLDKPFPIMAIPAKLYGLGVEVKDLH